MSSSVLHELARFQGDRTYFLGLAHNAMADRPAFEVGVEFLFATHLDADGEECAATKIGFSCCPDALESALGEVVEGARQRRANGERGETSSPSACGRYGSPI